MNQAKEALTASPAAAVTPISIVSALKVDGITIAVDANGVLSAVIPASAVQPLVTYDPSTGLLVVNGVTVTKITLTEEDLIGGVTWAPGNYLVTMDANGNQSLALYVPPAAGGASAPYTPLYLTVGIPAGANVVPAGVVKQNFTLPTGKSAIGVVAPDPGDGWSYEVYAGVVKVRNIASDAKAHSFPATTVKVAYQ